jgi:hypothetical protein
MEGQSSPRSGASQPASLPKVGAENKIIFGRQQTQATTNINQQDKQ